MVHPKDTNRKIRNTVIINIYEILIGSKPGSSSSNTGERMLETQQRRCVQSGLVFGTKIQPQYSIENVFLIFLLVSLTFGGRYLYIEKFSDEYYLEIRIY